MIDSTQSTFLNQPAEPITTNDEKPEPAVIPPSHNKINQNTILWATIIFISLLILGAVSIWALYK